MNLKKIQRTVENNNNGKGSGTSLTYRLIAIFITFEKPLAACRSVGCYQLHNQLINSKTSLSKYE
jgi:hypothetical protein